MHVSVDETDILAKCILGIRDYLKPRSMNKLTMRKAVASFKENFEVICNGFPLPDLFGESSLDRFPNRLSIVRR